MVPLKQILKAELILEKAILQALGAAKKQNIVVGPAWISKATGIYAGINTHLNDAIVTSLLRRLEERKKVVKDRQRNNRGGWRLADD